MAVKWAVANGNWNAGTTWNDGVVPTADDDVYLNGYTISVDTNYVVLCRELHNDMNPNTQISGGVLSGTDYMINADIISGNSLITSITRLSVTGNITILESVTMINISNATFTLTIVGNIDCRGHLYYTGYAGNYPNFHFDITGDIYVKSMFLTGLRENRNVNITINGNVYQYAEFSNVYYILVFNGGRWAFFNGLSIFDRLASTPKCSGILDISQSNMIIRADITIGTELLTISYNGDYPAESNVKKDVSYAFNQMVGTYDINQYLPPESVVLKDYEYGDSDDRKTGTMVQEVNVEVGCVTPEDVRKDVPLVGMGIVGSLVVPSVDDVREGVVFDNGSVGTLIVQGGGERLRIADFGYYTNAQSDTYIVDLTEQDKPKFAVAEERVLIDMFPDLDLDNIPEKYFDDLFVKYLKYRLIVEYYRTAGINSTFTPSEPTTEIVNYQNVRNEVWLNSANIYLKAWAKKYPESIVKPQRIIL